MENDAADDGHYDDEPGGRKMIITLILDGLFQGKLSNLIIGILMKMNLSQAEADVIYQNVFRANRDVFQWIGFMLLFLVGYYAVLSKTANYLKNIGDGIDNVLANSKQPIELETELEPIAEKLNTMKMTLARKERMAQESEQRKMIWSFIWHTISKRLSHL